MVPVGLFIQGTTFFLAIIIRSCQLLQGPLERLCMCREGPSSRSGVGGCVNSDCSFPLAVQITHQGACLLDTESPRGTRLGFLLKPHCCSVLHLCLFFPLFQGSPITPPNPIFAEPLGNLHDMKLFKIPNLPNPTIKYY